MAKKAQENQVTEVEKVEETMLQIGNLNLPSSIFEESEFEVLVEEFLSKKFLEEVQGVQLKGVMTDLVEKEIKGEVKDFVELHLLMANDEVKPVLAGQYKFIDLFRQKNKGNGVAVMFTFKGKIDLDGAKTMNDFEMSYKSL